MPFAAVTDLGLVRKNNEDSIYASDAPVGPLSNLFMVADGMGGHQGGEYASSFVVRKMQEKLRGRRRTGDIPRLLSRLTAEVNRELYAISCADPSLRGMGSTLVLATLKGGRLHAVNVGDSRLYYFEEGSLLQITRDHSLVDEMVEEGRLSRDDPFYARHKNVITRAMGTEDSVEEDYFSAVPLPGGRLLLCSDGLCGTVTDERIGQLLGSGLPADATARRLVEESRSLGGPDNISVIVVDITQSMLE